MEHYSINWRKGVKNTIVKGMPSYGSLLYSGVFGTTEIAGYFTDANGTSGYVKIGDRFHLTTALTVPNRTGSNSTIGVGCAALACENSPSFMVHGTDSDGSVFGSAEVAGQITKWKCDGKVIKTTFPETEINSAGLQELRQLVLFPLTTWYEPQDPDTKDFRAKYQANHSNTKEELLRFNDAIYFSSMNDEITLVVGAEEAECVAAGTVTAKKRAQKASVTKTATEETMLPWDSVNTNSVPNDFSVMSALLNKYTLPGTFGTVSEQNESFDFSQYMVGKDFLENYIDNVAFTRTLSSYVMYTNSLFRRNKLENKLSNGDIISFLNKEGVETTASNLQNVMLTGNPGTGKTATARAIAAALGLPILLVRFGERDDKDELTQTVNVTDKGFVSKKSPLYWFVKYGGIVVFDDMTNADSATLFNIIGGLLEAPYEYRVGEEYVKRHPMCFICATANVNTNGANEQNQALLTRFGIHIKAEKPSEDALKSMIFKRATYNAGYVPSDVKKLGPVVDYICNGFKKITDTVREIDKDAADTLLTLRGCISCLEMILDYEAAGLPWIPKDMLKDTLCNILYSGNREELQECIVKAIDSMPTKF